MRVSTAIGFVLVAAGLLYFLGELHIVNESNQFMSGGVLWPLGLVVLGLSGLRPVRRKGMSWWALYFIVLGLTLSIRSSGIAPVLAHVGGWGMFWALSFVFFGLSLLSPRQHRKPWVRFDVKGQWNEKFNGHVQEIVDNRREWKRDVRYSKWIGDISVGRSPWTLTDMNLWNHVGDVRVNLATAHVEDGEYHVRIGGWIGDVRVLVPSHLPVSVEASVGIGDVTVFDENSSGTGRHVHYVDPAFQTSPKKIVLHVDLKIGDVQVVRV